MGIATPSGSLGAFAPLIVGVRESQVRASVTDKLDGFATMLLAIISIARDGNWTASRPILYGTYAGCVVIHGLIATFFARVMPNIQSVCIVTNVGLVMATVLALPIGKVVNGETINSGSYVFGQLENHTTWPSGWTFMLAWLSPIWTIGAFDSCVHMSEEATNAARAVPLGILWSSGLCGILGFLSLAIIAAVINKDLEAVMNTTFGQPMAQVSGIFIIRTSRCTELCSQIYYDCLGKPGALGFMAVLAAVQFFMGLSLVSLYPYRHIYSQLTFFFFRLSVLPAKVGPSPETGLSHSPLSSATSVNDFATNQYAWSGVSSALP